MTTADPDGLIDVRVNLNGTGQTLAVRPDLSLAEILRDTCGLTATKIACGIGRCGSCLVEINAVAVNGCLVMGWQMDGAWIRTPEGLEATPEGRAVRQGLEEEVSFQCGYCAPGFTVALTTLLRDDPEIDEPAIRAALEGNICRCTGYASILRGALRAQEILLADRAE